MQENYNVDPASVSRVGLVCCGAHTHPHRDWALEGAGLVGEPLL